MNYELSSGYNQNSYKIPHRFIQQNIGVTKHVSYTPKTYKNNRTYLEIEPQNLYTDNRKRYQPQKQHYNIAKNVSAKHFKHGQTDSPNLHQKRSPSKLADDVRLFTPSDDNKNNKLAILMQENSNLVEELKFVQKNYEKASISFQCENQMLRQKVIRLEQILKQKQEELKLSQHHNYLNRMVYSPNKQKLPQSSILIKQYQQKFADCQNIYRKVSKALAKEHESNQVLKKENEKLKDANNLLLLNEKRLKDSIVKDVSDFVGMQLLLKRVNNLEKPLILSEVSQMTFRQVEEWKIRNKRHIFLPKEKKLQILLFDSENLALYLERSKDQLKKEINFLKDKNFNLSNVIQQKDRKISQLKVWNTQVQQECQRQQNIIQSFKSKQANQKADSLLRDGKRLSNHKQNPQNLSLLRKEPSQLKDEQQQKKKMRDKKLLQQEAQERQTKYERAIEKLNIEKAKLNEQLNDVKRKLTETKDEKVKQLSQLNKTWEEQFKKQSQHYKGEIKSEKQKVQNLTQQLSSTTHKFKQLKSKLNTSQQNLSKKQKLHSQKIDYLEAKLQTYNQKLNQQAIKYNKLNELFLKTDQQLIEKIKQMESLEKEYDNSQTLKDDYLRQKQKCQVLEREIEKLRSQIEEFNTLVKKEAAQAQDMKKRESELDSLYQNAAQQCTEYKQKYEKLLQLNSQLSLANQNLERKLSKYVQNSEPKKDDQIADLEKAGEENKREIIRLMEIILSNDNKNQQLNQKIHQLSANLDQANRLNSVQSNQLNEKNQALKNLEAHIYSLNTELSDNEILIRKKNNKIDELSSQLNQTKSKIQQLLKQLEDVKSEQKRDKSTLESELLRLRNEVNLREEKARKLDEEKTQMLEQIRVRDEQLQEKQVAFEKVMIEKNAQIEKLNEQRDQLILQQAENDRMIEQLKAQQEQTLSLNKNRQSATNQQKTKIFSLSNKISQLERILSQKDQQLVRLVNVIEQLRNNQTKTAQQFNQLQSAAKDHAKLIQNYEDKVSLLHVQLEAKKVEKVVLENQLLAFETQLDVIKAIVEENEKTIQQNKKQLEKLYENQQIFHEQISQLQNQLTQKENTISIVKQQLRAKEQQINLLKSEFNHQRSNQQQRTQILSDLTYQIKEKDREIQQLMRQIELKEQEIRELKESKQRQLFEMDEKHQKQLQEISQHHSQKQIVFEKKVTQLNREISQLSNELQTQKQSNVASCKTLTELEQQLSTTKQIVTELEKNLAVSTDQVDQLQQILDQQDKGKLQKENEEIQQLNKDIQQLNQKIEVLNSELEIANQLYQEIKEKYDMLTKKHQEAEKLINQLRLKEAQLKSQSDNRNSTKHSSEPIVDNNGLLPKNSDQIIVSFNFSGEILKKRTDHVKFLVQLIEKQTQHQIDSTELLYRKNMDSKDLTKKITQVFSNSEPSSLKAFLLLYRSKSNNDFGIFCCKIDEKHHLTLLVNLKTLEVFGPREGTTKNGYKDKSGGSIIEFGAEEIRIQKEEPSTLSLDFEVMGERYFEVERQNYFTNESGGKVKMQEVELHSISFRV